VCKIAISSIEYSGANELFERARFRTYLGCTTEIVYVTFVSRRKAILKRGSKSASGFI